MLRINPQLNGSVYTQIDMTLHLALWDVTIRTYVFGLTLQPMNLMGMVDIWNPTEKYCYRASYLSEFAGPIVVKPVLGTTECAFGSLGALIGDVKQGCQMSEYFPSLALYTKNFENILSFHDDYISQ